MGLPMSLYPTQKYHETHQVDQHISSPADYHQFIQSVESDTGIAIYRTTVLAAIIL